MHWSCVFLALTHWDDVIQENTHEFIAVLMWLSWSVEEWINSLISMTYPRFQGTLREEIWHYFFICSIVTQSSDRHLEHFQWNCPQVNITRLRLWYANIGSGNVFATSHYLNQCWRSSMSSYGITRPQYHGHQERFSLKGDSIIYFSLVTVISIEVLKCWNQYPCVGTSDIKQV